MAKKKTIVTLICMLFATTMFGSNVLFKMVTVSSETVSCTNEEKDLSPYAVVIGGEAKIGTTSAEAKNLLVTQSSCSYVRLDGGYLHVTLPRALKAGDQIYFTTYNDEAKTLYLTNSSTRAHWSGSGYDNEISPATTYTLVDKLATYSSLLNNSKDIYFHYGNDNAPYIKSLVITSDDDANVKDYLFDGLSTTTYSETTTDIFGGDIVVHSSSNSAAIQDLKGANVFYSNGNGKDKELEIKVTAPCNIEIYAAIASNAVAGRKLYLSDANNNSSALIKEGTEIYSIVEGDKGKIVKIKAEYNGLEAKSLYLSSSAGSWQVAAIRVVNKVLPVIAGNSGSLNASKTIWTSTTGNITVAEEIATTDAIKKESNATMNFSDKSSDNVLRLMGSKTYKVSVPSNKSIVSAYIEACANGASTNDAKLKVNGGSWTTLSYSANSTEPTIFTPTINASSFTIETNSRAAQVQIKLVLSNLGYYPISISGSWASFCAAEDVELPSGVYAYVGNVVTDEAEGDDVLTINKVESNKIPANQGVLLYSETDGDYELTSTTGAPVIEHNIFAGTVARTANPNTSTTYSLYDNAGTIEFWNYTGKYIPANKAYLSYSAPAGAPAKRLRVQVAPKMPTAVESIQQSAFSSQKVIENGQIVIIRDGVKYNVQGQIVK